MTDHAAAFDKLLTKIRSGIEPLAPDHAGEPIIDADPALHQLIFSFMLWNTTLTNAESAVRRLSEAVVDGNELRICMPDELAAMFGSRYPAAEERATRLKLTLHEIYNREHELTLASLTDMPKRKARQYLDSLEGCPGYVAARVTLLSLNGHAVPVDQKLHKQLLAAEAVPDDRDADACSSWLERHVRATDSLETSLLLEAWKHTPSPAGKTSTKSAGKAASKTTKKAGTRARNPSRSDWKAKA
ncbi:MAG: hypothetical protein AAF747_04990 [Planctomycetota bacterium]